MKSEHNLHPQVWSLENVMAAARTTMSAAGKVVADNQQEDLRRAGLAD